jgi:DNA-binding transcriptional MerR regulator
MSRFYQIHEFAALAGVTVKALRHYDRLDLLKPKRNRGGYRMYAETDLERLEQIIALKFLGVPLKQIKIVLDRPARALSETLQLQRRALEEKQELLSRTIRTIQVAEEAIERGKAADPAVLKRVIEVLDVASGGDPGVKAGLMNVWADRKNWTATLRWLEETLSMVTAERFDTAADFLDKAVAPADAQISK